MIKRTFLALGSATLLSACGFTPVHAPALGTNSSAFKSIAVETIVKGDEIDKEAAYYLGQRLRDRLGGEGSRHVLKVTPTLRRARLGISGDDIATRYDVSISSRYVLEDITTGDVLDSGSVSAVSSFGAPRDAYGRIAAEKNATQTVAAESADRILLRLASYYAKTAQ